MSITRKSQVQGELKHNRADVLLIIIIIIILDRFYIALFSALGRIHSVLVACDSERVSK